MSDRATFPGWPPTSQPVFQGFGSSSASTNHHLYSSSLFNVPEEPVGSVEKMDDGGIEQTRHSISLLSIVKPTNKEVFSGSASSTPNIFSSSNPSHLNLASSTSTRPSNIFNSTTSGFQTSLQSNEQSDIRDDSMGVDSPDDRNTPQTFSAPDDDSRFPKPSPVRRSASPGRTAFPKPSASSTFIKSIPITRPSSPGRTTFPKTSSSSTFIRSIPPTTRPPSQEQTLFSKPSPIGFMADFSQAHSQMLVVDECTEMTDQEMVMTDGGPGFDQTTGQGMVEDRPASGLFQLPSQGGLRTTTESTTFANSSQGLFPQPTSSNVLQQQTNNSFGMSFQNEQTLDQAQIRPEDMPVPLLYKKPNQPSFGMSSGFSPSFTSQQNFFERSSTGLLTGESQPSFGNPLNSGSQQNLFQSSSGGGSFSATVQAPTGDSFTSKPQFGTPQNAFQTTPSFGGFSGRTQPAFGINTSQSQPPFTPSQNLFQTSTGAGILQQQQKSSFGAIPNPPSSFTPSQSSSGAEIFKTQQQQQQSSFGTNPNPSPSFASSQNTFQNSTGAGSFQVQQQQQPSFGVNPNPSPSFAPSQNLFQSSTGAGNFEAQHQQQQLPSFGMNPNPSPSFTPSQTMFQSSISSGLFQGQSMRNSEENLNPSPSFAPSQSTALTPSSGRLFPGQTAEIFSKSQASNSSYNSTPPLFQTSTFQISSGWKPQGIFETNPVQGPPCSQSERPVCQDSPIHGLLQSESTQRLFADEPSVEMSRNENLVLPTSRFPLGQNTSSASLPSANHPPLFMSSSVPNDSGNQETGTQVVVGEDTEVQPSEPEPTVDPTQAELQRNEIEEDTESVQNTTDQADDEKQQDVGVEREEPETDSNQGVSMDTEGEISPESQPKEESSPDVENTEQDSEKTQKLAEKKDEKQVDDKEEEEPCPDLKVIEEWTEGVIAQRKKIRAIAVAKELASTREEQRFRVEMKLANRALSAAEREIGEQECHLKRSLARATQAKESEEVFYSVDGFTEEEVDELLPKVGSDEYYIYPNENLLKDMVMHGGASVLKDLEGVVIGRKGHGKIMFALPIDVTKLDVMKAVEIHPGHVVFLDESDKFKDIPMTVTLYQVFADYPSNAHRKTKLKLEEYCEKSGINMVSYDKEGTWVFKLDQIKF